MWDIDSATFNNMFFSLYLYSAFAEVQFLGYFRCVPTW